MDENQQNGRSHLFLVRLWLDQTGDITISEGLSQGKVQHLISGKASHFSDWSSLIDLFASMVTTSQSEAALPSQVAISDPSDGTIAGESNTCVHT